MENATKALLMAAGVLIGLAILSLAVYLFTTFGVASAEMHGQIEQDRINQFNAQFTSYQQRNDLTIYDVITVVNLAKNNNEYYELNTSTNSNNYITVNAELKSGSKANLERQSTEELQELIKKETDINNMIDYTDENGTTYKGLYHYSCTVTVNDNTRRVNLIRFYKN